MKKYSRLFFPLWLILYLPAVFWEGRVFEIMQLVSWLFFAIFAIGFLKFAVARHKHDFPSKEKSESSQQPPQQPTEPSASAKPQRDGPNPSAGSKDRGERRVIYLRSWYEAEKIR